jgi:hypothetical protein
VHCVARHRPGEALARVGAAKVIFDDVVAIAVSVSDLNVRTHSLVPWPLNIVGLFDVRLRDQQA